MGGIRRISNLVSIQKRKVDGLSSIIIQINCIVKKEKKNIRAERTAVKTIDRRKNVTGYFKYKPLKDRNRERLDRVG